MLLLLAADDDSCCCCIFTRVETRVLTHAYACLLLRHNARTPLLLAVAVFTALLCIAAALPMPRTSTRLPRAACDCPKPDECDKHACPGGCFYNSTLRLCITASAGFYAQLTNASASNLDTPCPCGSFTPVRGSVACSACAIGQYASESASTSCGACGAGTQCPYTGMCSDIPCAVGTYSSTVGSIGKQLFSIALRCLLPLASFHPLFTVCTVCPPGFCCPYIGMIKPIPCPSAQACPSGTSVCPSAPLL